MRFPSGSVREPAGIGADADERSGSTCEREYAMRTWTAFATAAAVVVAAGCNGNNAVTVAPVSATPTVVVRAPGTGNVATLTVTSTAFANGAVMPTQEAQVGCGGSNISPDLAWSGAPAGTQSFAITEFDPDAPTGSGFWHWVYFNIPPNVTSIAGGAGTNPPSGTSGLSDYGTLGYGGPCPPVGDGNHHYTFTVYALDTILTGMPPNTTGAFLVFNMGGHIIAQGKYLGLFSR